MNLVKVATGLYWLEIPEKNLYLMCGCPMDSIKHLENSGIIHVMDRDDCYMESGPNAILLSDLAVQNGYFSNLAEFPILHMMYKQGMVLPGHPGNSGEKPWLIGTSDQVEAQKKYIFRGNYGLASQDEFRACGCSEEEVDIMWKLKMKFNFGTIHPAEKLVLTTVVEDKPVELRPGVQMTRKGLNIYSINYNGESVTIDLNLKKNDQYEPPYKLKPQEINREFFSIIHMGEGNGWDNDRPCMGSILSYKGKYYLIDAGPNIEYSLDALGISVNDIEGIFHTHIHDDHFAGLTYLVMADHRIRYYATASVTETARQKLSALMGQEESIFDLILNPIELKDGEWNNMEGLEVLPSFSPHPVETSIFHFRVKEGNDYKSYAHLADIPSKRVLKGFIGDEASGGISKDFYDRVWQDYLKYADVKKIDVGRGLIHGEAEDFITDLSAKVILSHLDRDLNDEEKKIGVRVEFGDQDVLICCKNNYNLQQARGILSSYFPDTSWTDLEMLLDCPMVDFPAGTVIAEDSSEMDDALMILSGKVNYIFSETGSSHQMTAGSTVGLLNGLWNKPIQGTYEAAVAVKALVIPKKLFIDFLTKNSALDATKKVSKIIFDLRTSNIFGSRISNTILVGLAQRAATVHLLPGDTIPGGWPKDLYLLKKGCVDIYRGGEKVGKLRKWDTWGGYTVYPLDPVAKKVGFEAKISSKSPCEFYRISHEVINNIPVVQWKLYQLWSTWSHIS